MPIVDRDDSGFFVYKIVHSHRYPLLPVFQVNRVDSGLVYVFSIFFPPPPQPFLVRDQCRQYYLLKFPSFTPLPPPQGFVCLLFCSIKFHFTSDGMRCFRRTGLGFVCFVVINPCVLANGVDFGRFLFHKFSNFTRPPSVPTSLHHGAPRPSNSGCHSRYPGSVRLLREHNERGWTVSGFFDVMKRGIVCLFRVRITDLFLKQEK